MIKSGCHVDCCVPMNMSNHQHAPQTKDGTTIIYTVGLKATQELKPLHTCFQFRPNLLYLRLQPKEHSLLRQFVVPRASLTKCPKRSQLHQVIKITQRCVFGCPCDCPVLFIRNGAILMHIAQRQFLSFLSC